MWQNGAIMNHIAVSGSSALLYFCLLFFCFVVLLLCGSFTCLMVSTQNQPDAFGFIIPLFIVACAAALFNGLHDFFFLP